MGMGTAVRTLKTWGNNYFMTPDTTNPFEYRKPDEKGVADITAIRAKCKELYDLLLTYPSSREISLAITKLEEVSMWANKSIVFNGNGAPTE